MIICFITKLCKIPGVLPANTKIAAFKWIIFRSHDNLNADFGYCNFPNSPTHTDDAQVLLEWNSTTNMNGL